jgi:hypothetical protein
MLVSSRGMLTGPRCNRFIASFFVARPYFKDGLHNIILFILASLYCSLLFAQSRLWLKSLLSNGIISATQTCSISLLPWYMKRAFHVSLRARGSAPCVRRGPFTYAPCLSGGLIMRHCPPKVAVNCRLCCQVCCHRRSSQDIGMRCLKEHQKQLAIPYSTLSCRRKCQIDYLVSSEMIL